MDIKQLKNFIDKNIVDFSELVLNNYHKLDLDETDAIILIKLQKMISKGVTFLSPKELSKSLSITPAKTEKRLNSLIDREFIVIALGKCANGREKENYNLDLIYEKIIKADYQERKGENTHKTSESELVDLFEEEFKKPLSILDIQTLTKWLGEDHYSFDEIKEALFIAVKARKLSTKYVDGILLKNKIEVPKVYKKTNLMRDLHKLWEK